MDDLIASSFLTDSRAGKDTVFVDAEEVVLASITHEGNVLLTLKGVPQAVQVDCETFKQARNLIEMLGLARNSMCIDRDNQAYNGDPSLVSREALVKAKMVRKGSTTAFKAKAKKLNQKLRQLASNNRIYAIKACRDATGMSLTESKAHVDALLMGKEPSFGKYAREIDISVLDSYVF